MDLSFLQSTGTVKDMFAPKSGSALMTYLFNWAEDVTEQLRQSALTKANATGGLAQSMQAIPSQEQDKVVVSISMDDYYDFINKGVNGVRQTVGSPYSFRTPYANSNMVSAILGEGGRGWIGAKGYKPDSGTTIRDYEAFAWGIATNKKKFGIEPTHFYDDVITEQLIQDLKTDLEKSFGLQLEVIIASKWQ
jgi:hypothetical protein